MTQNSDSPVQHFYLRLKSEAHPNHTEGYKTHPVGVLAIQKKYGNYHMTGSMANRNDAFFKKVGVAKALGRLKSRRNYAIISSVLDPNVVESYAQNLGLKTAADENYFNDVDWADASRKMASAMKVLEEKVTPKQA